MSTVSSVVETLPNYTLNRKSSELLRLRTNSWDEINDGGDDFVDNLIQERTNALKQSHIFSHCPENTLKKIAPHLVPATFYKGEKIIKQNEPCRRIYMVVKGNVVRERHFRNNTTHQIRLLGTDRGTFGACYALKEQPSDATARVVSETAQVYCLTSKALRSLIAADSELALNILSSVTEELKLFSEEIHTPLFETQTSLAPIATTLAASIEAFYRSALNSILNSHLSRQKLKLFPAMHIQLPTRIVYINGFKGIRNFLDENVNVNSVSNQGILRTALAIAPGLLMTPFSSVLEACNISGSMNTNQEPVSKMWTRGLVPRGVREIMFGLGINQMSNYLSEMRFEMVPDNDFAHKVVGSLMAGVTCGYFSQLPHNLSALKLMYPKESYKDLYNQLVQRQLTRVQKSPWRVPPSLHLTAAKTLTAVAPTGFLIRSCQIAGSFIIINGTIELFFKKYGPDKEMSC